MTRAFRAVEAAILHALAGRPADSEAVDVGSLAEDLRLDQSRVAGAVAALEEGGLVRVSETRIESYRPGVKSAAWNQEGSPERRVARAIATLGGSAGIRELPERAGLDQKEVGQALRWLAQRGWAVKVRDRLDLGPEWPGEGEPRICEDERLVAHLLAGEIEQTPAELEAAGIPVDRALSLLEGRSGVVELRHRRRRSVALTDAGRALAEGGISAREEVSELTTEMLVSGRWREASFRGYDVTLTGPRLPVGKAHPFRRILEATRRAFLDMGFEETRSPWVESAFWDFDALFQPQDHPARDMQDTFYVSHPESCALPDPSLVDRVRRTHESGGDTGSTGWRYRWDENLASRPVLRTHTTAATVRELALDPFPPRRVFSVGPVFRRETIDYKHLPMFHQVDGIVIDQEASFASLLTLLSSFYEKMGFDRIQFRPAFFPYTEPSVEVFVWMESRRDWIEMGGAGVFRAEVTEPLGCRVPVLAWGLGLERVAMFRFDLDDIRELYMSRLDWLERVPTCRS